MVLILLQGKIMAISFDDLCKKLKLPKAYQKEENLHAIETWCHANVSQDLHPSGSPEDKYREYLAFAENYLDNFLVNLPEDFTKKVASYGDISAIHYAAQQGYDRFIENTDITKGINQGDANGMTPLHKAAIEGHYFTVQALVHQGADVHKMDKQKQLPIQRALFVPIIFDNSSIANKEKIFHVLFPLTPEIATHVDTDGNSIMHLLATNGFNSLTSAVLAEYEKLAFVGNNASNYPINSAILNNQLNIANTLLAIKGVAELKDQEERLPLHYAARYGSAEMVQSCCSATADINSKDGQDRTPLLWAAEAGNLDALTTLIANGANPELTDYSGRSILDIAKNESHEELVTWIRNNLDVNGLNLEHENNNAKFL